jgi:hypothetical protein
MHTRWGQEKLFHEKKACEECNWTVPLKHISVANPLRKSDKTICNVSCSLEDGRFIVLLPQFFYLTCGPRISVSDPPPPLFRVTDPIPSSRISSWQIYTAPSAHQYPIQTSAATTTDSGSLIPTPPQYSARWISNLSRYSIMDIRSPMPPPPPIMVSSSPSFVGSWISNPPLEKADCCSLDLISHYGVGRGGGADLFSFLLMGVNVVSLIPPPITDGKPSMLTLSPPVADGKSRILGPRQSNGGFPIFSMEDSNPPSP